MLWQRLQGKKSSPLKQCGTIPTTKEISASLVSAPSIPYLTHRTPVTNFTIFIALWLLPTPDRYAPSKIFVVTQPSIHSRSCCANIRHLLAPSFIFSSVFYLYITRELEPLVSARLLNFRRSLQSNGLSISSNSVHNGRRVRVDLLSISASFRCCHLCLWHLHSTAGIYRPEVTPPMFFLRVSALVRAKLPSSPR